MTNARIIYMNSFGRSGETLLLRSLNAHSDIHALVQLLHRRNETLQSYRLFEELRKSGSDQIEVDESLGESIGARGKRNIVVKAAVWEPPPAARGFVLIRNPFAVVHSYLEKFSATDGEGRRPAAKWIRRIDQKMAQFVDGCDIVTAICIAWNRRYSDPCLRCKPIIHYEEFVKDPESNLRRVLAAVDVNWDEAVLSSHKSFNEGDVGHGGIRLWEPIHGNSVNSWQSFSGRRINRIRTLCYPIMRSFGYHLDDNELMIEATG